MKIKNLSGRLFFGILGTKVSVKAGNLKQELWFSYFFCLNFGRFFFSFLTLGPWSQPRSLCEVNVSVLVFF